MKIIKGRYDLVFYFFFPFVILTTLLYFFFYKFFLATAQINLLLGFTLFIFIFLPQSGHTLRKTTSLRQKNSIFLLQLFLSQIIINLSMWSFAKIISATAIPVVQLSIFAGFFPWAFMTLFAVTLGYFIYGKQTARGLVSSCYTPLFNNTHLDSIGVMADTYMRVIPLCLTAFSLSALSLSFMLLLHLITHWPLNFGLLPSVIVSNCALLLLFSNQTVIKLLHKLQYQRMPVVIILLLFSLSLAVIYSLLNFLTSFLTFLNTASDYVMPLDSHFQISNTMIIIIFWWLGLAAVNGAYIAYKGKNKTYREIILYSFFANLLGWMLIYLIDRSYEHYAIKLLPLIVQIFCNVIVMTGMWQEKIFSYFLRATLPLQQPIKKRSKFRFLKILPFCSTVLMSSYFAFNTSVWSYVAVLCLLPPVMIIMISFVCFLVDALQQH